MTDIELDKAISAAMHASGSSVTGYDPLPNSAGLIVASEGGDGGGGNAFALDGIQNSDASYPGAFKFVASNANGTLFNVNNPYVCNGKDIITATGGTGLGNGDYYCRVDKDKNGTVTAKIQQGNSTGEDTVLLVPIATVDSTGVKQHHVGVIVVGGGGADLIGNTDDSEKTSGSPVRFISGNDSNVVVYTYGDELSIDVYYV